MARSSTIPARAGVGLKAQHYEAVLDSRPDLGWFEVHAENYMGAGGPPHHYLARIRRDYPLSLHGVGLSVGGAAPLDEAHLARFKDLAERRKTHTSWPLSASTSLVLTKVTSSSSVIPAWKLNT